MDSTYAAREHRKTVIAAGVIAIATNLLLTVVKIVVGAVSGSLAILSDALHGLVDAASGLVVIISEKVKPYLAASNFTAPDSPTTSTPTPTPAASTPTPTSTVAPPVNFPSSPAPASSATSVPTVQPTTPTAQPVAQPAPTTPAPAKPNPLSKLPFIASLRQHSDVERLGARIIAVIIILVSVHILIEAIQGLLSPPEINFSLLTVAILAITTVAKIALAIFLRKTGAKTHSATLKASSIESMNDSLISVAVLVSTLIYSVFHVNIESYISIAVAVVIFKSGFDLLRPPKSSRSPQKLS